MADAETTHNAPTAPSTSPTTPSPDASPADAPPPALPRHPRSGPADALTDVRGLRVGHAQRTGDGWLTGTTVVLAPEGGAVAAVDVRGGGPGTRETDALDPRNLVQRVEAVVLTGGSAFGLDAASGVVSWLEDQGRGFRVGPDPAHVVPVVPAAALFDLGRGGDWRARPDAALGREAAEAAARTRWGAPGAEGAAGAGTGAVAGGLKGGTGSASVVLPSGITVAAVAAVNAAGSVLDPLTGALYGQLYGDVTGERPRFPTEREHAAALRRLATARAESERRSALSVRPPLNTTLAVVATDAVLTRAQAQKLAGTAHDGLARAVRPGHLLSDGDTVFALATGDRPLVDPATVAPAGPAATADEAAETTAATATTAAATGSAGEAALSDPAFRVHLEAGALNEVLAAGADVLTRAVVKAVLAAEGVDGPGGVFPAYRDLYPDMYRNL
ncbi:P1 family peptidase [Streptomyces sp. H27-D2]|uniref:P1 family peptidase n=1 Tax=Streptomyces sp. H27-D2 TaxID=3046304 RepID=UPI002DB8DA3D|nr:P1 family peptidase [Streptomyces sp. H27-D2]MEC4015282.1 P1 family peptidase [Streptomyces sp. H27-D2]